MALSRNQRLLHLRRLVHQIEASPPSPERDELLRRTRLRVVEIEVEESDVDPPSPLPTLANEPILRPLPRRRRRARPWQQGAPNGGKYW
jgi:hypothetical protein